MRLQARSQSRTLPRYQKQIASEKPLLFPSRSLPSHYGVLPINEVIESLRLLRGALEKIEGTHMAIDPVREALAKRRSGKRVALST